MVSKDRRQNEKTLGHLLSLIEFYNKMENRRVGIAHNIAQNEEKTTA